MAQPDFRTNKPQDVTIANMVHHVTYSGKCVVCGTRCYAGMGAAYLEHSDNSLVASEHSMTGADVVLCFMCANDSKRYARGLAIAYAAWGANYLNPA